MLQIYVVEKTAEGRSELIELMERLIHENAKEKELLPRINLRPTSLNELKFQQKPNLCLLGPDLIAEEQTLVQTVSKRLEGCPVICVLDDRISKPTQISQLIKKGARDVIRKTCTSEEFVYRILVHLYHAPKSTKGEVILVDSGKGGLGSTTLAAALGDSLHLSGKRVCLVDLDEKSQDLSRFLKVRPYINENLDMLLQANRPVTKEFVDQSLVKVFEDSGELWLMPPASDKDEYHDSSSNYARSFASVLDELDSEFDVVLIDVAHARGNLARMLYRGADKVVYVVDNDPASIFATVDSLNEKLHHVSSEAKVLIQINKVQKYGLSQALVVRELERVIRDERVQISPYTIPHCQAGMRWAGSGETFLSVSTGASKKALEAFARELDSDTPKVSAGEATTESSFTPSSIIRLFQKSTQEKLSLRAVKRLKQDPPRLALPELPAVPPAAKKLVSEATLLEGNGGPLPSPRNDTVKQEERRETLFTPPVLSD